MSEESPLSFRPRRGRILPLTMGGIALALTGVVAVLMGSTGWKPGDQLMLVTLGLLMFALMWRYASIRADATPSGLRVRNLMLSRTVPWAEIERIRFQDGDPWVSLDLAEGDALAVMAIQRADGERGREQARRLADLIRSRRQAT